MRRRNFIAGLASTTAAWPFTAHAQQAERMRRVGILIPLRMGRGKDHRFRKAIFGWRSGSPSSARCRTRASEGRCDRYAGRGADRGAASRDCNHSYRHGFGGRCARGGLYHKPCTSRGQHNRLDTARDRAGHKAVAAHEGVAAGHGPHRIAVERERCRRAKSTIRSRCDSINGSSIVTIA